MTPKPPPALSPWPQWLQSSRNPEETSYTSFAGAATTCHTADGSQDSIVWPLSGWKSSVDAHRQPRPVDVTQAGMPDTRTGVTQRANQQNQVHTAAFQAP